MSFAARPHQVLGPTLGPQLSAMTLAGATPSSVVRQVTLQFNPDGTLSRTNQMADPEITVVPTNWYLPTTGAIGESYNVKFVLLSGTAWNAGLLNNTEYWLASARQVSWSLPVGGAVQASVAVSLVDYATGLTVASSTLTIDLLSDY